MRIGNIEISRVAVGSTAATALAVGSTVVWQAQPPAPVVADWLCFTAVDAGAKIRLDKNGSPAAVSLETSTDGTTWTDYSWNGTTGDETTLANVGDKVYFRAKNENLAFNTDYMNYYKFVSSTSNKIAASGNIQSLLKADCSRTDAPANCYRNIFSDCTSLTTAPALPATTLASSCYGSMFSDCTSLTAAPALPETTLAGMCYDSMFKGCTSLTAAPALPATTLVYWCYNEMFYGCSSLSSVEVAFTDWTSAATASWLNNVAASGTFTCPAALGTDSTITRGANNCPTDWTVVNV